MNKLIKIFSIIAVIFSGLAILLSVALLTFLWEPVNICINNHTLIIENDPIIPIEAASMLISIVFALILLFTSTTPKGIAIEIITIIVLFIVMPILIPFLGFVQEIWIGRSMGSNALATVDTTSSLLNFPMCYTGLANCLSVIACGMRIAEKTFYKENTKENDII